MEELSRADNRVWAIVSFAFERQSESKPPKKPNLKAEKVVDMVVTGVAVVPLAVPVLPFGGRLLMAAAILVHAAAPAWDMWLYHKRKYENNSKEEV